MPGGLGHISLIVASPSPGALSEMLRVLSSISFHVCLSETGAFYLAQVVLELKHVYLMMLFLVIGCMLSVSF